MLKIYKFGGLELIVTDEDIAFEEDGKIYWLSEETGWRTEDGKIYVWAKELSRLEKLGIGVHEFVEHVLVKKLKVPDWWAHRVANVLEAIVSFGKSKLYWR